MPRPNPNNHAKLLGRMLALRVAKNFFECGARVEDIYTYFYVLNLGKGNPIRKSFEFNIHDQIDIHKAMGFSPEETIEYLEMRHRHGPALPLETVLKHFKELVYDYKGKTP